MARRTRLFMLMAVLVVAPFAIACGAAEEPAPEPAPTEEPPPAPEPEPAPPAEEPADNGPQEPELVGEIRVSGENFDWITEQTTNESAAYWWTATVTNDTTATLNITVDFEFLDEQDQVVKTETARVRLDPAQSRSIREEGTMAYDQANRIYSFRAVTDFEIVTS